MARHSKTSPIRVRKTTIAKYRRLALMTGQSITLLADQALRLAWDYWRTHPIEIKVWTDRRNVDRAPILADITKVDP